MRLFLSALFMVTAIPALAQEEKAVLPQLSVETIFSSAARIRGSGVFHWAGDGQSYLTLERSEAVDDGQDVVRYSAATGAREVVVWAQDLIAPGEKSPLQLDDFQLSPDGSALLVKTNSQAFRRTQPYGDFWLVDLKRRTLRRMGGDAPPGTMMYADFSPDGRAIAYVRGSDLYQQATDGGSAPRRLTNDGSDVIVNGTGDWAYEEEFGLAKAFTWSPDSKRIAFWRFDTSPVGVFRMMKNTSRPYPEEIAIRIPKVGTSNSQVRVGSVDVASGETTWIQFPVEPDETYIPQMSWAASSSRLLIQSANREQNGFQVWDADALTGQAKRLFAERDAAWVEKNADPIWLRGGRSFLWLSERDGWRHLYDVSRDDGRSVLRTPGNFDVVAIAGVDDVSGWVYFVASPANATRRYLYRAALSGKPRIERVTPSDRVGWNQYDIAPGGKWAVEATSSREVPPVIRIVSLPDDRIVRSLQNNATLAQLVAANPVPPTEFVRLDIGSGVQLDAWVMKPTGFDPKKKYPILFQVYGEPAGVTVTDQWAGPRGLWHRMLAQRGYIVASIDPRGTPQPRGRAWRKSIYRQVGILASADFAAGVRRLLADRPYIDRARVGIWGWSGGGAMTLNAMFRYPDLFKTGIDVSGPADQLLYDTIYQERYMGLPSENAKGYFEGSPINFVQNLKGSLLLIYGTGDDNVHYQHMEQLVDRLIAANKQVTVMPYPDRAHFLTEMLVGNATSIHMFTLMTNFLDRNLKGSPSNSIGGNGRAQAD